MHIAQCLRGCASKIFRHLSLSNSIAAITTTDATIAAQRESLRAQTLRADSGEVQRPIGKWQLYKRLVSEQQ
jgi:hypothetical protein